MIRRILTPFISISGLGATILTIMVLTVLPNLRSIAGENPEEKMLGEENRQELEKKSPSCGKPYRKKCDSYYQMNQWHHDDISYGRATINIWHKVSYDHSRSQYRYDYKIEYNGSKNVLMRWDVLDRMRSENPDSSCILDLRRCYPHKFTMWCDEAPIKKKGMIQLYNNRPNTDDWNYWQCNQTSECSGPIPISYPEQWWPSNQVRCKRLEILK